MKAYKYLLLATLIAVTGYYLFAPQILERFLVVDSPLVEADAIVLMAGSKNHRIPAVVDLYQKGFAPKILLANDGISGAWSIKHQKNLYMVEWAREDLLEAGIPEENIVLLDYTDSGSIFDALNTRAFVLGDPSIRSLLVATSHYHTRRTLWTFNQVFSEANIEIGVYPIPKDPDYQGRYLRTYTTELLKLIYYWIRY